MTSHARHPGESRDPVSFPTPPDSGVRRGDGEASRIRVVDSHTEGEPTRVVIDGWPMPNGDTMAERRDDLRARFDHLRRGVVCEPRGHDAVVGALLTPPVSQSAAAGIVFFNNGTYLGMCGHGLIGVVRTLAYLGRLTEGRHAFDTPVGTVRAELAPDGSVTIENVPASLQLRDLTLDVPEYGRVTGDVAYGGNWFFITHDSPVAVEMRNARALTRYTHAVQSAIDAAHIVLPPDTGVIDHVEVSGPSTIADARNFVLCSGGEYDRSPCGTGTSATMAARHARGQLAEGEQWRQEGIAGGVFTGWLARRADGVLVPNVRGTAYVTAESTLVLDAHDPFRFGIGA